MYAHTRRLVIDATAPVASTLPEDVRRGLLSTPKTLPPKYFYDERGSRLFEAICDTEEYYPTRAEEALLAAVALALLDGIRPDALVELGSGGPRKVRHLLRACDRLGLRCAYQPLDVSGSMMRASANELLEEFPWLHVHGVVGDYAVDLGRLPRGGKRLIAFLGGTIGNLDTGEDRQLLGAIARELGPDDRFVVGLHLLCDEAAIHRAYNDRAGLTAAFNKNVLSVINRELDGTFAADRFEHVAFFDRKRARVEMHLRATAAHTVELRRLALAIPFDVGETIRTEISRKFDRASFERLLSSAGLALETWETDGRVAIAVARRQATRPGSPIP